MSIRITTRRKLASIAIATLVFATVGGLGIMAAGLPLRIGITEAIIVGFGVGVFEEFYVQGKRGRRMRHMHPLRYLIRYTIVVAAIYLAAVHFSLWLYGRLDVLPFFYSRIPIAVPVFVCVSVIGILVMRVAHFIGIRNLFHLMLGTYHRPVLERMVILFLDINGSTAIAARLGAFRSRDLVVRFLADASEPITDLRGEVYLYKGDGFIATWPWDRAMRDATILRAIDALAAAIARESARYERDFGVAPTFRIGVHGGDVVVSEQGDTKRSIGIYGDVINIAARLEEAARSHGVTCVLSGAVAEGLGSAAVGLRPLGDEEVRGIGASVPIVGYEPRGLAAAAPLGRGSAEPAAERVSG